MLDREVLLEAYSQLTNCCYPVWNWKFDRLFNVIKSDCPSESLYKSLFLAEGRRDAIEKHMAESTFPLICTVQPILSWIVAFELSEDSGIESIYIKGPFFNGYNDSKSYDSILQSLELTGDAKETMVRSLKKLPMLTASSVLQLALMLHYCIHGTVISAQEVAAYTSRMELEPFKVRVTSDQFHGTTGYWNLEGEILYKVRHGDLDVNGVIERATAVPTGVYDGDRKNLELYRQNIHNLLTLVSRAAVDGGLPRKSSFSLCANYRRELNICQSVAELAMLSHNILADYVQRVHKLKKYSSCSKQIRLCCEYIETHLEGKLTLSSLAGKVGYTEYYLSKKFKKEIGCSIVDYIQKEKLERARALLTSTQASIDEISDSLGYGSRSYFSSMFKKEFGETPTDYRKKYGEI